MGLFAEATHSEAPEPFLKWAGGKRWLTGRASDVVPAEYNRYIEPFLGGGAIFFATNPKIGSLSDCNSRLIETYIAIRDEWQEVVRLLNKHQREHSKSHYYEERSRRYRSNSKRAAQFLYLNRTCWNGLYRVNLKGEFNVPMGTKSSVLLNTDNFEMTSNMLKNISINVRDFSQSIKSSRDNDFIFCDPPYTVKHNMNGFVKYNESIFSWSDQERLKNSLERAHFRGSKITLTNANHQSIIDLYSSPIWKLEKLDRASVIAASSEFRAKTSELLVRNW